MECTGKIADTVFKCRLTKLVNRLLQMTKNRNCLESTCGEILQIATASVHCIQHTNDKVRMERRELGSEHRALPMEDVLRTLSVVFGIPNAHNSVRFRGGLLISEVRGE